MKMTRHLALVLGTFLTAGVSLPALAQFVGGGGVNQPAGNKVAGVITDASGAPAAGVQVTVMPAFGMSREAKSDASGHYEVSWQPANFGGGFGGNVIYSVLARDVEHNQAAIHDMDEKTTNLDLHLEPGIILSARVEDTNGRPIANATVFLIVYSGDFGTGVNPAAQADTNGRAEFKAVPQGQRYGLSVSAQGYGSTNQEVSAEKTKAATYEFPKSVLKTADRPIAGRVVDAGGQAVARAMVNFYGQGQPNGFTNTDDQGRFAFKVVEGRVNLQANGQGNFGNVSARAGDTNITIRFGQNGNNQDTAPVQTTGKITDPSGAPAAGVSVVIRPANGVNQNLKTDAEGKYSISWQPLNGGGTYSLIARDAARNLAALVDVDEETTNKDAQLQPGFTLAGTVQDNNGAAVPGAQVNCMANNGNFGFQIEQRAIAVNAQGAFEIPGLPRDIRYTLNIRAPGYGLATATVQPDDTHSNRVTLPPLVMKIADKLIAGKVVGPDDKPVSGAMVQTIGQGQTGTVSRTGSDGHFELKVVEGSFRLMASSPGGNGTSVQARSGDTNVVIKLASVGAGRGGGNIQALPRDKPLKPQPWTLTSIKAWPGAHKPVFIVLLSLQVLVLAGVTIGVFRAARPKQP